MLLAGLSHSPLLLVAGLLIAGASAGLVFPPFSDVVARASTRSAAGACCRRSAPAPAGAWPSRRRWRSSSAPSGAPPGSSSPRSRSWRPLGRCGVLPAGRDRGGELPALRPSWFVCPRSGPLLAGALVIGLASSVYWTFAVDLMRERGRRCRAPRAVGCWRSWAWRASRRWSSGDAARRAGAGPTFAAAVVGEGAALALLAAGAGLARARGALGRAVRRRLQRRDDGRGAVERGGVRRQAVRRARRGHVRQRRRPAARAADRRVRRRPAQECRPSSPEAPCCLPRRALLAPRRGALAPAAA